MNSRGERYPSALWGESRCSDQSKRICGHCSPQSGASTAVGIPVLLEDVAVCLSTVLATDPRRDSPVKIIRRIKHNGSLADL
jgi:hypothetical protein